MICLNGLALYRQTSLRKRWAKQLWTRATNLQWKHTELKQTERERRQTERKSIKTIQNLKKLCEQLHEKMNGERGKRMQKNAKELFLIHIPGAAMGASSLWTKEREAVPSLQSRVPFATRYTVYTILIHFTPQLLGLLYFLLKLRNYEE